MPIIRTQAPFLKYDASSYAPGEVRKLSGRSKRRPYPFSISASDDDGFLPHKRRRQSENGGTGDDTASSTGAVQLALKSSKSFVASIKICGVRLRPTVAFDTFWRFAAERKAIDDRRRAGEPAP